MLVHDKAHELVRALKQAPEYGELNASRAKLQQDQAAYKMFLDFRRKELQYEALKLSGQNVPEGLEAALPKLREIVYLNSLIRDYLQAEARFGTIFNDIQRIIGDSLKEVTEIYSELTEEEGGNE
jgi:cell fate (sporulation/competence/biofilm development) regulator YlbF (YheA/YmcA/DUF963 family)